MPPLSISTSFPSDRQVDFVLPTLILLSTDSVHFYVHQDVLMTVSTNGFHGLLSKDPSGALDDGKDSDRSRPIPITPVTMVSDTLNVVLHAAYRTSCTQFAPSLDTLIEAVDLLPAYGISPPTCIYASSEASSNASPLYTLLLSLAPLHPLPIYSLAAHHSLDDLAVASSQHLLSTRLHAVSDQVALRMGPVYLKRLSFLLLGRVEALKTLILEPPSPHASTPWCGAEEQTRLSQDWTSAAGSLLWDAHSNLPTSSIEASLRPLGIRIQCHLCQRALSDRVYEVITQWDKVKCQFIHLIVFLRQRTPDLNHFSEQYDESTSGPYQPLTRNN